MTAKTNAPRLTYTVDEAAAVLGISRSLAYELVRTARLPHLRLGNRIVVPRAALDHLVNPADPRDSFSQIS